MVRITALGQQYALEGRVPGCKRLGRGWVIPEGARKPEMLPTVPKRIDVKMKCVLDEY